MGHLLKLSVLPLIALIAGVTSLYIDPKENRSGKKILLAVLLLGALGSIAIAVSDDTDSQNEKTRANIENKKLEDTVQNQSETLVAIRGNTEEIKTRLSSWGLSEDKLAQIKKSISADEARKTILPVLRKEQSGAPKIQIEYFPKQVDGAIVFDALREGGFDVSTGKGKDVNKDLPTNAVWVGDSVSLDDAKFVALTLIRAGVDLKSVRRFVEGGGSKSNLIQVGTDHNLLNRPSLSVNDIQNLSSITRDT